MLARLPPPAHSGGAGSLGRWVVTSAFPSPRLLLTATELACLPAPRARSDVLRPAKAPKKPVVSGADVLREGACLDADERAEGGWGADAWDAAGGIADRLSLMGSLELYRGPQSQHGADERAPAQLKEMLEAEARKAYSQAKCAKAPDIQHPSFRVRLASPLICRCH